MYIFGGNDIRMGLMNNLWCLDLSSFGDLNEPNSFHDSIEWKAVRTHGSQPGKLLRVKTRLFWQFLSYCLLLTLIDQLSVCI